MFFNEISSMMHFFGDVTKPEEKSVKLMQSLLKDQMNLLLFEAEKVAYIRDSITITHEDVLFLMRKNKMKLKRLLEYLEVLDMKQVFCGNSKYARVTLYNPELKGKWVEKCLKFLEKIEDCDELTSFVRNENIIDPTSKKRKMRSYWMTHKMSSEEYEEFTQTSQATFYPLERFKRWLLEDEVIVYGVTDDAIRIISFLARETIAETVHMVLLMKMKRNGKYQYLPYDIIAYSAQSHHSLNASEGENTFLEDECSCSTAVNHICSRNELVTGKQSSENNFNGDHLTYTAHNNICSSGNRDSKNKPEYRNILSRKPSKGSLEERETRNQCICDTCASKSFAKSHFDFSECFSDAESIAGVSYVGSSESEPNSVSAPSKKSAEEVFSKLPRIFEGTRDVSDDDIMDISDPEDTKRNNNTDPEKKSVTNIYTARDGSMTLQNEQSHSCKQLKVTPATGNSSQLQDGNGFEYISDTSDHESFSSEMMACCDRRKTYRRKINTNSCQKKTSCEKPLTGQSKADSPSKKTACEKLGTDQSTVASASKKIARQVSVEAHTAPLRHLSVSAKNEVEYITPVQPGEISHAYYCFQQPSQLNWRLVHYYRMPRKTKLICLAEPLSYDLR